MDPVVHPIFDHLFISNANACFDWTGWYGENADQIGGVQMAAITNMVNQILSG